MKRQFAIFVTASLLIGGLGWAYNPQVVAGLNSFYPRQMTAAKADLVLELSPDEVASEGALVATQRVLARRLEQLSPAGEYGVVAARNQLHLALPTSENLPYLVDVLTRIGEVEFINGGASLPPIGQQIKTSWYDGGEEGVYQTLFTAHEMTGIAPPNAGTGEIFYQISVQPSITTRFAELARDANQPFICLVIDKQVINCSTMYHLSGDTLDILPKIGSGAGLSLSDVAVFFKSGPLPGPVRVITD